MNSLVYCSLAVFSPRHYLKPPLQYFSFHPCRADGGVTTGVSVLNPGDVSRGSQALFSAPWLCPVSGIVVVLFGSSFLQNILITPPCQTVFWLRPPLHFHLKRRVFDVMRSSLKTSNIPWRFFDRTSFACSDRPHPWSVPTHPVAPSFLEGRLNRF